MARRKWDGKTKLEMVLQGLKGKAVAEICNEYQISQAQYYQWRDQFLKNAAKVFETGGVNHREAGLERENSKLKCLVGELTLEVKKTAELLGDA